MPKFKFMDNDKFVIMVSEMFHDQGKEVGEIAAALVDQIEGKNGQDVMCALSFLVAFIIDCVPEKKEGLDEFINVVSSLINFDQPAFKGKSDLQ